MLGYLANVLGSGCSHTGWPLGAARSARFTLTGTGRFRELPWLLALFCSPEAGEWLSARIPAAEPLRTPG